MSPLGCATLLFIVIGVAMLLDSHPHSSSDSTTPPSSVAIQFGIEQYMRDQLNDPSSLKIYSLSTPFSTSEGWSVTCEYGAKNAFGAMVRKSGKFTLKDDTVVGATLDE